MSNGDARVSAPIEAASRPVDTAIERHLDRRSPTLNTAVNTAVFNEAGRQMMRSVELREHEQAQSSRDPTVLMTMAGSVSSSTRLAVAGNEATPTEVLTKLANDAAFDVKSAARSRLQSRGVEVPTFLTSLASGEISPHLVTTLHCPPGYRVVRGLGVASALTSASGFTAGMKGNEALYAAMSQLRTRAKELGGNAIVALSQSSFGAAGGITSVGGDAVGVLLIGTVVHVEPLTDGDVEQ